jgi:uncharacterized damage-inducible protein DinB
MKQQLQTELAAALEYFNRSTSALTEEDSGFSPAEGVFTAAQQVAHAAKTMDFVAHETAARAVTSLADARAWLSTAVENAKQAIDAHTDEEWGQPLPAGPVMGGAPRAAIFGAITDHTAHHRGALTIYARLRGKTPPMPYM